MTRRRVRVDAQFFAELDAQLGDDRGPNGEPSTSDFLLIELPTIAEEFAERFDDLLRLYPERDDDRCLVTGGRHVDDPEPGNSDEQGRKPLFHAWRI